MNRTFLCAAALFAAATLPAQDPDLGLPDNSLRAEKPIFTGKAIPGAKKGTESWIVHFEKAPYSLEAYRNEMWGDRDPDKVDAIVADIVAKMKAGRAEFVADVEALGGTVVDQWWIVNACVIEVEPKHLGAIEKLANVDYLQPNEATFPLIRTATNSSNHNSDALQAAGNTGTRVGVSIIDTSFDDNMNGTGNVHITFTRRGATSSTAAGGRFCHRQKIGTQPFDMSHPHGTGVASVSAGWRWRTATADVGHVFDAVIAGFSIANSTTGGSTLANEAAGYNGTAAIAARCRIVSSNLSYSGSSNPLSVEQKAMDSLALNSDVVNATAAGNNGSSVASSLSNLNGLSVAAVNENSHTVASFSSRGLQGGRYFPNIAANGVSTNMARQNNENADYLASGTSMASPMVCGGAALIRDINTNLRSDETIAILLASTENNHLSGSTIKVLGSGAGYMKLDCAKDIATNATRHGRATLVTRGQTFTRSITVKAQERVQCAIKWHRHDVNSTSYANLDLKLVNAANVTVVNSDSPANLEEFVRYTSPTAQTLTMVVTLVSLGLGQRSQTFGWACKNTTGSGGKIGSCTPRGKGCPGGKALPGGCTVLPKAFTTKMGSSANTFPHARANMRYQQVFLGSEIGGANTFTELCLRLDERFGGPAQAQRIQLYLGGSKFNHTNIGTSFAGNYNAVVPRTLKFSGTLNLPSHSGGGNTNSFSVCMKFNTPFSWPGNAGENLITEFINTSPSAQSHFEDFDVNGAGNTTTRLYAFSSSAATATSLFRVNGLIMCLKGRGGPGQVPVHGCVGVPGIGKAYTLNVTNAAAPGPALFFLGAGPLNLTLPGNCTLLCRLDILLAVVPVNATTCSAAIRLGIPNDRRLLCAKYCTQAFVIDTQGAFLNIAAFANALDHVVGN